MGGDGRVMDDPVNDRPFALRQGTWVAGGLAVSMAAGLAINILIPRILPPVKAGELFLAIAAVSVISFIFRFGLERSVVREIATARAGTANMLPSLVRDVVLIAALIWVCAFLALSLGGWEWLAWHIFGSNRLAAEAVLIAMWVACETVRVIISECFRGLHRILSATWLGNAGRSLVFLALLLPLLCTSGIDRLRLCLAAAALASAAVLLLALCSVVYRVGLKKILKSKGPMDFLHLARASWPFYITALWAFVSNQGDVLIGGAVLPSDQVAYYAAASKLSLLLAIPLVSLTQFLAPEIPRLWSTGKARALEERIRTLTTVCAVPVILLGLVFILGGRQLISGLFPSSYVHAAPALAILSMGPLTAALTGPNGFTLLMTSRGPLVARITVIISAVQVVAMALFGRAWGMVGLAFASSTGTVILNIALSLAIRRSLGLATEPYARPTDLRRGWRAIGARADRAP